MSQICLRETVAAGMVFGAKQDPRISYKLICSTSAFGRIWYSFLCDSFGVSKCGMWHWIQHSFLRCPRRNNCFVCLQIWNANLYPLRS